MSLPSTYLSSVIWEHVEFSAQIQLPYSHLVTLCYITETIAARMMGTSYWILNINWTINSQLPFGTRVQIPVTIRHVAPVETWYMWHIKI